MMDCEVKEYFSILLEACHVEEISLDVAYRQLRELLERLCRTQMPDGSLHPLSCPAPSPPPPEPPPGPDQAQKNARTTQGAGVGITE